MFEAGAEVVAGTASRQKRRVDALDINPTVLHGFDAVRDLDDLARGGVGIGEGAIGSELFHAALYLSGAASDKSRTINTVSKPFQWV